MARHTHCIPVYGLSIDRSKGQIHFEHNGHTHRWDIKASQVHVVSSNPLSVEAIVPEGVPGYGAFMAGEAVKLYPAPPARPIDDGGW